MPASSLRIVLFPAPDGPASARQRPVGTSNVTSSSMLPTECCSSARSTAAGRLTRDELDGQQQCRGDGDENRGKRESRRKVGRELVVYREWHGLSDTAKRPGEHQRRAELTERPPPGERESCQQPG